MAVSWEVVKPGMLLVNVRSGMRVHVYDENMKLAIKYEVE